MGGASEQEVDGLQQECVWQVYTACNLCITFKSRISHNILYTCTHMHTVHTPNDGPATIEDSISETDSSEGSDLPSSPEDNDTDTITTTHHNGISIGTVTLKS